VEHFIGPFFMLAVVVAMAGGLKCLLRIQMHMKAKQRWNSVSSKIPNAPSRALTTRTSIGGDSGIGSHGGGPTAHQPVLDYGSIFTVAKAASSASLDASKVASEVDGVSQC
jgi:hypothetical protein